MAGKGGRAPTLETTITYLEMRAPPRPASLSAPVKVAFLKAEKTPISFYRYLYNVVGEPWLWYERRALGDDMLAAVIHDPAVDVFVLYAEGAPAGFAELDRREMPSIELAYFGLMPERIGQGLGRCLLAWTLDAAWTHEPERVWVHTCTFDHPKALAVYQRAGFVPYRQERRVFEDPRKTGLLPADLPLPS